MHTRSTIIALVLAALTLAVAVAVTVVSWLGPGRGLSAVVAALMLGALVYALLVKPFISRWGALHTEMTRSMPGDDLLPVASTKTCAIGIFSSPENVWPWLVQIGFGRAGWYSYDWIDNDGKPSATRILPELQTLATGDRIDMAPGMSVIVVAVDPQHSIVCASPDGAMTWCLTLLSMNGRITRLVSRWRLRASTSLVAALFMPIVEVGSFIMERRMLIGIKERAERLATETKQIPAGFVGG